jgi:hypothetical protein
MYAGEEEFAGSLVPFIREGVDADEPEPSFPRPGAGSPHP